MTALELQESKTDAEIAIIKILSMFNKISVENGFQIETITLNTTKNDWDRTFDVDIHIV